MDLRTPDEIEDATNKLLRRWGVRRVFTRYDSFDSFADVLKEIGVSVKYEDVAHTVRLLSHAFFFVGRDLDSNCFSPESA